jgi:hypothetical protein
MSKTKKTNRAAGFYLKLNYKNFNSIFFLNNSIIKFIEFA